MKHLGNILCLLALAFLCGCGGGEEGFGGGGGGGGGTQPPPGLNITGNWQFSLASTAGHPPATIAGSITQSGGTVHGAVHLDGSTCFDQPTTIGLTGGLSGSNFSLASTSVDGQVITFNGTLSATSNDISGTYGINGGCASGDQGSITGLKIPVLAGTWRIILNVNDAHAIDRATLTQDAASSEGSFGISGTTFINGPSCFSGTITSGTFPNGSYIMGTSVNLEIKTADGTIFLTGTYQDGEIIGYYETSAGGVCGGVANFGGACLGRTTGFCHLPPF